MTTKKRKAIDFHYAENAILAYLYTEFIHDRAINFEIKALFDGIPRVSKNVLRVSIESLTTDGFLDKKEKTLTRPARSNRNSPLSMAMNLHASEEYQVDVFRISKHGISRVEEFSGEYYDKIVSDVTAEPQISSAPKASTIPAADRTVPLDHNGNPYKEAVEALDKALEEFRKDHPKDNEIGPEKGALLKTLEAGRKLLEDTEIKIDTATATLLNPLTIFAARYEKELVAVLATAALNALTNLLKLG